MTFVSYAQNFEDVMLWRALRHVAHGFYIDVGAGHPDESSVTRAFYARSDLDLAAPALLPDEEVKARLTAVRGLGEWTADWFLARYLGRPRAWPAGDLALRKAVRALYGDVDVRAAGERFEPFQNLTAHYLLAQFLTP